MFGKKGRGRRKDRREARQEKRATRKDDRRNAKLERIALRQEARSGRVGMRQETKQSAYEAGFDPNAHWGDTLSGAGDVFTGVGAMASGFKNPMLPLPENMDGEDKGMEKKKEQSGLDLGGFELSPTILIAGAGLLYMFLK